MQHRLLFLLLPLSGVLTPGVRQSAAAPVILIRNLTADTTLRYPLALLRGEVDVPDGTEVSVVNESGPGAGREFRTRVTDKRFVVLADLATGVNRLKISAAGGLLHLPIRYQPQTNPYYVRLVYYTEQAGDTAYQSERPNDPQNYAARLETSARLLQTFTAESMNDQGLGRKTFNLELDGSGKPVVHVVRGSQPTAYYHAKDGGTLWSEIYGDLNRRMPDARAKNLVIMAFTRFDSDTKVAKAHTALGGGNLGLFGSAGLFAWPGTTAEIQEAFNDTTRVDAARTHDDSNGRSTYWGLASTTLGAVIHEMGHTFGLPHSTDPMDIMTRGFDHLNRRFTVVEPPHARRPTPRSFQDTEIAQFRPISAQRLAHSHWFQLDAPRERPEPALGAEVDLTTGKITAHARYGLRLVGINGGGDAQANDYFPEDAPTRKEYALEELQRRAGGKALSLALMDADGNERRLGAERFRKAP